MSYSLVRQVVKNDCEQFYGKWTTFILCLYEKVFFSKLIRLGPRNRNLKKKRMKRKGEKKSNIQYWKKAYLHIFIKLSSIDILLSREKR